MKRLIYTQILLAMLVGFASCQQDPDLMPEQEVERTDNLPIQLEVSIGSAVDTRSVEQAKRFFSAGNPETGETADIIHIESTFHLEEDGITSIQKRYCALEFTEEGKWVQKGGSNFAWPNTAVSGDFKAYYVHGSTGELTANEGSGSTTTTQTLFTDLVDGRDPMRADTVGFRYGHTVGLRFEHILTHLTIIELDAGIDDRLSIEAEPEKPVSSDTGVQGGTTGAEFNNAFKISLANGSSGPEINFEFLRVEDKTTKQATVQAPTELVRDKQTRQESCQVGFFLEPDCIYNKFNIYYSTGAQYLEYVNSDPNSKDVLKGNNRYTFNVKKSAGVTITQKPEQKWDESDDFTEIVDAEGFLTAITKNEGYIEDKVVILEPTTNPIGTRLIRNVKFKDPYYHVFPHEEDVEAGIPAYDFVPNVGDDNVFDGGYHYIKELCCPLFFENHGTIKNLGFLDMNIGGPKYGPWLSMEAYKEEKSVKTYDYSNTGAVATQNYGRMQNIRIKNLTVNVGVVSGTGDTEASLEVHSVGALFGINTSGGYAEQVHLSGNIDITVDNAQNTDSPRVYVGGLAGQNVGSLIDVSQLVDNSPELKEDHKPKPASIRITNKMFGGTGDYEIGGIVGNNTGKLSEVSIPTTPTAANGNAEAVTIDCSQSFGVISYLGGVAGIADSSQGNEISSCLIGSGTLTAGTTGKTAYADAYSYTGGLVGVYHERTHIYNCTTFCSVIGATAGSNTLTLATGGIFGEIKKIQANESGQADPEGTMGPLAAFGKQLEGDNAGCFAGLVYGTDKTWDNTYNERADVKAFGNTPYIGITK